MTTVFDIKTLWTVFKDIGTSLIGQAYKKKDDVVNAHKSINTAFIKTYDYLRNRLVNIFQTQNLLKFGIKPLHL